MTKHLYGKNVFLTGGSSGIGLSAAELFAKSGYIVYAGSRNPALGVRKFSGGGEIRPIAIDVCSEESVDRAAKAVLTEADIGIVIHCAGVGIACAGEDFVQGVTSLFDTNLYGLLRVNSRFLPHLRTRGGGICIMIGSVAAVYSLPFQSHYSASKAATVSYAKALRMELRQHHVRVSVVSPGDTATGFTDARKYETDENSPHFDALCAAVKKMEKDEIDGRPPLSVARAVFKVCARKNPPIHTIVGFDYKLLVFLSRLLPERMIEFLLRSIYRR